MKKLPEYMMMMLRGRRDLEEGDDSQDEAILKHLTPFKAVRECCAWKLGDPEWADEIARMMVHCGVKIKGFFPSE